MSNSQSREKATPVQLSRISQDIIEIEWSDGSTLQYKARRLRDACPCATCREKRGETSQDSDAETEPRPSMVLPVLSAEEARPLTIVALRPVGNYAYNIAFSDGHRSGLFSLELLYELGQRG